MDNSLIRRPPLPGPGRFLLAFLVLGFSAILVAEPPPTQPPPEYSRDLKPVFRARCYACHGALKQKAGLRLDTGKALRQGGKEGAIIVTNDVAASRLLQRLTSRDKDERMPPEGEPLAEAQVDAIRRWIAAGAPSPADEQPETDPRDHWAFRPPARPQAPPVRADGFLIRNPIDAFIAARWDSTDASVTPPADRARLLRRVHLDLTGLPPTRAQLHAFLQDTREDAYERVVEDLLNSPQYGERWARHWMDVWRYADWFGRRHVPDVWNSAPQIWRWRDWIVKSLNEDKGYDQMVLEMLAGDEIAPTDVQVHVATGFLVRNWYALNPNQWMRENVEHTAKAFLGLTINCAHCHDHKYDPITQRDYFQFRAFFEPLGLRQDWVPGEPDPGPFQKYDYSTLRKVVKDGSVRVLDENLEAKTYLYLRGDERSFPPDKPFVDASVPAFLRPREFHVEPVALPADAAYPGLQEFIRTTRRDERRKALTAAQTDFDEATRNLVRTRSGAEQFLATPTTNSASASVLTQTLRAATAWTLASNRLASARAESEALDARIAADAARHLGLPGDTNALAAAASRAERSAALANKRLKLAEATAAQALLESEQQLAEARRSLETQGAEKRKAAATEAVESLKKAKEKAANAQSAVAAAEAALATNSLAYTRLSPVYPAHSTGRRTALARWITRRDNPLAARVAVNHVWNWHFHEPLVKTVYDFGRNGATPTHPELLDWLAVEFMEHGWSLKHLHRLLVTSSTYRQATTTPSPTTSAGPDRDPGNRLFRRMNTGRLESEIVRDAILRAAGSLDLTRGGYPVANTNADVVLRRSLYFECFPEDGGHDAFTEMFDPPDPGECYRRTRTIIPQQALALSNSRLCDEQSRALARHLWDTLPSDRRTAESFIIGAFETVLSRAPTPAEVQVSREFLEARPPNETSRNDAPATARAGLIRSLFNHNDFITIR